MAYLNNTINLLKVEIKKHEEAIKTLRGVIAMLEDKGNKNVPIYSKEKQPWLFGEGEETETEAEIIEKNIEYAFSRTFSGNGRPQAIDPIADALINIGRFATKYEILGITGPITAISSTLSTAKREGKRGIVSYSPTGAQKHTYWGFAMWLNSDGVPKVEFMPKKDDDFIPHLNFNSQIKGG